MPGYIGHLKERTLKDQMAKDSTEVIRKAVLCLLPRNKLHNDSTFFSYKGLLLPGKIWHRWVIDSLGLKVVSPTLFAAEKEEAKAVLTSFLKKQGLRKALAARTINKWDLFIDHLVSKLHSEHKSWYLAGSELTTLEIRDSLIPYPESLFEEHGAILVDVVENYPNPPVRDKSAVPIPPPSPVCQTQKLKAVPRVSEVDTDGGSLCPHIVYLMELDQLNLDDDDENDELNDSTMKDVNLDESTSGEASHFPDEEKGPQLDPTVAP